MLFLVGLIGALLGGAIWGFGGAVLGALVGPALLALYRQSKKKDSAAPVDVPALPDDVLEAPVTALARRVQALEDEVAELRAQVQALSSGEASLAQQDGAPRPVEKPAAPAVIATPPIAVAPIVVPPLAAKAEPEPAAAMPIPPIAPMPPIPQPAMAEAAAAAADTAWSAPSPRPAPPPAVPLRDRLPPFVSRFVFGGNTIVKVGVLILFLGLAFLLRYAAERVSVPVELRYAGVALVGAFLLGLGWRLRDRRDAYGLILQGAGIGVFYLTALAAIKLHPL